MINILVIMSAAACTFGQELDIDFRGDKVDRALFAPDVKGSKARWRLTAADGLVALIPRGPADRQPIKYTSRFDLEGDFEILADYRAADLPPPHVPPGKDAGAASNNIELVISNPGGWATVNRRNTRSGELWGYFAKVGELESPSPGQRGGGKAGRLGIRRVGDRLTFLRGGEASPMEELGTIDSFRGPVTEVSLQVNPWNSTDALKVSFPRMQVKADRIIRHDGLDGHSWSGPARVVALLAVAAGLAIAARVLIRRHYSARRA